jgi:hypothetical protein
MSKCDWDEARAHAEHIDALLAQYEGNPELADIRRVIDQAHEDAHAAFAGDASASDEYAEFAWVKTHLDKKAKPLRRDHETYSSKSGGLFGVRKYEKFDPGWMETLAEYLVHLLTRKPHFGVSPQCIEIADDASLAIVGDWGSGYWEGKDTAASKIATLAQSADYTIHLGDTYYAGTKHQVPHHLGAFPSGRRGRFAIPGNHEMYPKGVPFYALLPQHFPLQSGTSFFALRSPNWLVLALDTAYFARDMYLKGTLGPEGNAQREFAAALLKDLGPRRVILLTHHTPFDLTGKHVRDLHDEVRNLFGGGWPDYWAFGHIHGAARYSPHAAPYRARLIGHGAIPFGVASELAGNARVEWYETVSANDLAYPERVTNGFLRLDLAGPACNEKLIAEDGAVRWHGSF